MAGIIKLISSITNNVHDLIIKMCSVMGFNLTDKQLHFIVIAVIGMIIYLITNQIFKALAKYSVAILSFIYTFTVLLVIVFAIEIEQKITKRGNMEFKDIVAGVWGFIVVFGFYLLIVSIVYLVKNSVTKYKKKKIESNL